MRIPQEGCGNGRLRTGPQPSTEGSTTLNPEKAMEVPVPCEELRHTALQAKGGDVGIMDEIAPGPLLPSGPGP
jgi:hypothetical protein